MLRLEEYIAKRKIEDHLNEFDVEQKVNNIKTSIDYVFEYFNQYLPLEGVENHSPELKRWFVQMYDETGHQVNKTIMKFCGLLKMLTIVSEFDIVEKVGKVR